MNEFKYVGEELDVFAHAVNWKAYFRSHIASSIRGDVLEVGAGIGATTRVLCDGTQRSWTCLEPDAELARRLSASAAAHPFPLPVKVSVGCLADQEAAGKYDSILYMDVLEHIEKDREELACAADRLNPGGSIVVLCPAHQSLYTAFDAKIGHYRRYNKAMYRALQPPGLKLETLIYLDSVGLLLSVGNRLLLRSGTPTRRQVELWDRWFVSGSRILDPLLRRRIGKSIVGIWRKAEDNTEELGRV